MVSRTPCLLAAAALPWLLLATSAAAQEPPASNQAPAVAENPAGEVASVQEERSVLRAQVLLDRVHFSSGEIDGREGGNLRKAVAGFQRSRGLADDGRLGPITWAELERDAVPTLVDYTVLPADVAGKFEPLPTDMMEKAKLDTLGYTSVGEALGERFHASPKLLASLNAGKPLDVAGTVIRVPNVAGAPAPAAATQVIVDKSDGTVLLATADGTVVAQFPATTGSKRDPLPLGEWKVTAIAVDPTFSYNPDLFWDANPAHSKALLPAGPNNPVGLVWIGLSKEHYGIHGTPEPSRIGKGESHGCIRVTNWTAMLLSSVVTNGMPVLLRE